MNRSKSARALVVLLGLLLIDGDGWARGGPGGKSGGRGGGGHSGGRHYGGHFGGGGWSHRGGNYGRYRGHYPHRFRRQGISNFGFYFGPSFGWPYYGSPYYYPYYRDYLYPPIIVTEPPVYIEQGNAATSSDSTEHDWYFCRASQAYYPYVKECPAGWVRVPPEPPGQESGYWYRCENPEGYYPYIRECSEGWTKEIPETPSLP